MSPDSDTQVCLYIHAGERSANGPAGASFNQSPLPSATNFGGRVVGESSETLGTDNCFFQGSIVPKPGSEANCQPIQDRLRSTNPH
jgi:hypothetical protein